MRRRLDDTMRFWSRVKKGAPEECWPWIGHIGRDGYGVFYVAKINGIAVLVIAHRYSMELHLGRKLIKPSKQLIGRELVLHKCDNPACVNPSHLFLGTQADNIRDRDRKQRQSKGEHRYNHKLTENDVRKIRKLRSKGKTLAEIAGMFGLNNSTVDSIAKREWWKHVE